ncbi:MAG: YraN family protein [Elusimicrobia bacterium]|nr:YraN family protein [Elusimicrobiota bacterium]
MKCPKCGFDVPEDRSWCEFCGEPFHKDKPASQLDQAAAFIEGLGWKILEREWKCADGSVDFICRDDSVLVFVDVQFDPSGSLGPSKYMLDASAKAAALKVGRKFQESRDLQADRVRYDALVQTKTATRHDRNVMGVK